jgi:hypothetical protein
MWPLKQTACGGRFMKMNRSPQAVSLEFGVIELLPLPGRATFLCEWWAIRCSNTCVFLCIASTKMLVHFGSIKIGNCFLGKFESFSFLFHLAHI